ncbi:hypothetical protein MDA_GLEAN10009165 [Myotis davidii]|uniref:Uncharacterized protein n=1 Tax=Myotis davidii TaxID=225400 RepID=L5M5Z3_MYODS|nr:hypothetical protein MDA_GLEAN10009165 [Myotis davidii]
MSSSSGGWFPSLLPALLQQGHPQRAAPHPGLHPARRAAKRRCSLSVAQE